jgi:hypothetical protein
MVAKFAKLAHFVIVDLINSGNRFMSSTTHIRYRHRIPPSDGGLLEHHYQPDTQFKHIARALRKKFEKGARARSLACPCRIIHLRLPNII